MSMYMTAIILAIENTHIVEVNSSINVLTSETVAQLHHCMFPFIVDTAIVAIKNTLCTYSYWWMLKRSEVLLDL